MKKYKLQLLLIFIIILIIFSTFSSNTQTINAQEIIISNDVALQLAISYSTNDGLMGGAIIPPEKIYGQITTYNEAIQFVSSRPIDLNTKQYEIKDRIVWLILLEGKFVEYVPPSAGGDISATEVIHNQMVIILDGTTGEIMREILISPQRVLPVTGLLVLESQETANVEIPTLAPISTEKPYPTLTPIPAETIEAITETVISTPTETITSTP